mmetsp:Transcript_25856/g.86928  ORF Transcript_25856/g.86928 Transcript_25856/m.86928 type:complete len:352 (-) Transcript_25856:221-1276(-)
MTERLLSAGDVGRLEKGKPDKAPADEAKDASNGFAFTSANIGFVAAALFFNTVSAPLVKLTQNAGGGYDYNKWCVYVFAELFKLAFSIAWCGRAYMAGNEQLKRHLSISKADFAQYAVPALVFFAQNNLSFLALQHMSSSAFQLLMNTRIVTVAILSIIVLRKQFNTLEWVSIVLLMLGAMQYQLSSCAAAAYRVDSSGLVIMAAIVCCAAGGNVYTQKVMQKKMDQPLMLQNAMLYLWGVLFNCANWAFSVLNAPSDAPVAVFGNVGSKEVFSMVFYAAYGLSISVILKRFGAVTRTFINSSAICATALVDVLCFGESVTLLELTTFATIMIAVFIHSNLAQHYNPNDKA